MRGDGDGWATGPDGSRHWGKHGAAGLLLRAPLPDETPAVLLQHRAAWSHQGGTWALPGGARDSHETTTHAAVREAHEEAGIDSAAIRVRTEVVTMEAASGWSYTTVIADAERPLPTVPNGESTELRWVREADVAGLPLHPGFEAGWPRLRTTEVRLLFARYDVLGERGALPQLSKALPRTVRLPDGMYGWLPRIEVLESADTVGLLAEPVGHGTTLGTVTAVVATDPELVEQLPATVVVLTPATVLGWLDQP
ncbi:MULTISPECIES: NUDIX hydrolase [unclassified Rhodococcus (in: high G+C Gram-positive bacteria)]|uniref:NUDIX hydrolase n=1 Tax=unclassified Rhodococcus (in: high G+C Gram-positive bacteria) TaxID=192944 RepID=UPI00163B3220|nr:MULTISPECIES: NUDIX hydrolase [unclassified Rhodococcus (in: high G+C Gram-positive bacteria)]MBC2639586.1 NUDIX hydrolase [Rhodococcus sp. 3A]MBC2895669.1 NUDIX hydrolase [Rhodococcus sp. 4CII]